MSEPETAGAGREPIFDPGDRLSEQWVKALRARSSTRSSSAPLQSTSPTPTMPPNADARLLGAAHRGGGGSGARERQSPDRARPDVQATATGSCPALVLELDRSHGHPRPITAQYIPLYQRIGQLSPSERATADLLVAHEAAERDFAQAEIAGDRATSLEPIRALDHMALSAPVDPPARSPS